MAYGTPGSPAEIEAYYTGIRRGNPPTPEALANLTQRYEAIGGVSPLMRRTESQASAIQRALDQTHSGRFQVAIGLKHATPTIEHTATTLVADGCTEVVGLVLAPHFSASSVGQYLQRAGDTLADLEARFVGIESWAREPALIEFLADEVRVRLDAMDARADPGRIRVLFTAHSLPQRVVDAGDPYEDELRATAEAVANRVGLSNWAIAWQSAGRTPEPWIGPDILTTLDEIARDDLADAVIVCPCGFVADHLEVLYDLDIEAATRANSNNLGFDRTRSVNDDPAVMSALARRIAAPEFSIR